MLGRKIGVYEVTAAIGRGGMGEVYQARDSRLDRDVALKVLPEQLAREPDRLARFEREARVLASLQHQNIASLYGLEDVDGQPVLVMELAEGEDLSVRLARGALPLDEVDRIARQLARGLEYAHEKGIVHRDLKPANIKVAGDGKVKILDFGLARAFQAEGVAEPDSVDLPAATLTQALTGAGTVLGTAAYMSPEQARGYDVDRRADIWAFGVVVYEMLTGKQLFAGDTATDTLAAVLRQEPDWQALPDGASPLLAHLLRRCLEKDPSQRLRDIGEARVALEGSSTSLSGWTPPSGAFAAMPAAAAPRARLPWVLCGVLAVAACGLAWLGVSGALGPKPEPPATLQAEISLPAGRQMNLTPTGPAPAAISPDGMRLVFGARDSSGTASLFVRDIDKRDARPVAGTQQAAYPFWGPDDRTVAFFGQSGRLEKVDVNGGPVVAVCPAENGKGGSWHAEGGIVFAPSHNSAIYLVTAEGGTPEPVTDLEADGGARSHRFPRWLPDGIHFLYLSVLRAPAGSSFDATVRLGSADGSVDRELMPVQTNAVPVDGHLLYLHDGVLLARPFDAASLSFTGPADPLFDGVMGIGAAHLSAFDAVGGRIVYSNGEAAQANMRIHRIGRDGEDKGTVGDPVLSVTLNSSPDGRSLLLGLADMQRGTFDLWTLDVERNVPSRFTLAPESEMAGAWSPDGTWIAYSGDTGGSFDIYRKRANGSGQPELLLQDRQDLYVSDWTIPGVLAYTAIDSVGETSIGFLDPERPGDKAVLREVPYQCMAPGLSPDGRWLMYASTETGVREIYIESFGDGEGRWRISTGGAFLSRWSRKGDRVYYLTDNGELMAVDVEIDGATLRPGAPRVITDSIMVAPYWTFCEDPATGDVIAMKPLRTLANSRLNLVDGWRNLLTRADDR